MPQHIQRLIPMRWWNNFSIWFWKFCWTLSNIKNDDKRGSAQLISHITVDFSLGEQCFAGDMKDFSLFVHLKILKFKHVILGLVWGLFENEKQNENEEKSEWRKFALAPTLTLILYPEAEWIRTHTFCYPSNFRKEIFTLGFWSLRKESLKVRLLAQVKLKTHLNLLIADP